MADDVVDNWDELIDDTENVSPLEKEIEAIKLEFFQSNLDHNLTLLMFVAMTGKEKALLALIKNGANINEKNMNGYSALTYAVLNGHFKCVQILVANCADINSKHEHNDTLLMLAAKRGFDDIVQCLLNAGARKSKKSHTALYLAACHGELNCLQTLIKAGINLNTIDSKGVTVLMSAASKGLSEVIRCFVQADAKVDLKCKEGRTALSYASSNGHLRCVKMLHLYKANLNLADRIGQTPLMKAAKNGDIHIVYYLVKLLSEEELSVKCKEGKTAFFYAAEFGHLECVKIFNDICIDETDNEGETPLTKAIFRDHPEVVEYLLRRGARCDTITKAGMSAVHCAAAGGSLTLLQYVLRYDKRKPRIVENLQNRHGQTPLMLAAAYRNENIVHYLLTKKADVNVRCYNSWTALHYASHSGRIRCIRNIAYVITDINERTGKDGKTALMLACMKGMHTVVAFLIKLKVDVNIRCLKGRTALHYAALNGSIACVEELLKAKARIDQTDKYDETPLLLAARCGRQRIIKFLVEHITEVYMTNNVPPYYPRLPRKLKRINLSYEKAYISFVSLKEKQNTIRGKYSKKLAKKLDYNLRRSRVHVRKHARPFNYKNYFNSADIAYYTKTDVPTKLTILGPSREDGPGCCCVFNTRNVHLLSQWSGTSEIYIYNSVGIPVYSVCFTIGHIEINKIIRNIRK